MILNVSSRCDIVAFYSKWFMNRYRKGYVDVRNPFNPKLVSRIYFSDVDLILFCTKNPLPIIDYLDELDKPIIFHITITPYNKDIEPNVDKSHIIDSIKRVSKLIGKDYLYIRYDPIFISDKYNIDYHIKAFNKLCVLLDGYINKIIISFMDIYKNVIKNKDILKYKDMTKEDYHTIASNFSKIAKSHHITIQTCCEDISLEEYGIFKGECLSHELAYILTGKKYSNWKARKCNCVSMVDIGSYNLCKHLCRYCYANYDEDKIYINNLNHDDNSSLLIGYLNDNDIIKRRYK